MTGGNGRLERPGPWCHTLLLGLKQRLQTGDLHDKYNLKMCLIWPRQ